MQQLHLVGWSPDNGALVFSGRRGSASGNYLVRVDDRLLTTIADALIRAGAVTPAEQVEIARALARSARPGLRPDRPQSRLTPRQIQSELRIGRSVADVAEEAGVDEEWVERFAPPVRAEQARVIDMAATLFVVRARQGASAEPLAAAVNANLVERGVRLRPEAVPSAWTAHQLVDSRWVVLVSYEAKGRVHAAEWELDTGPRTLQPRNRLAAQLGWVDPPASRTEPAPDELPFVEE